MDAPDTVDPAALERLVEWGGEKLRDQMVRLFLENSEVRVAQIVAGFEAGEAKEVERGAHSLKSSAANVGARALVSLAERMEDAASRGDLERARPLLEPLEHARRGAAERLREIAGDGED